jgi:hypothetical protein
MLLPRIREHPYPHLRAVCREGGMSEDIAPYIVGFARVTLGDTDGFTYDEDNEEPLFSWVEDGRISSLPWSEAVQRFGSPGSD